MTTAQTTTEASPTAFRGASLADAMAHLNFLQGQQYDVVVAREDISASGGRLQVKTPRGMITVAPTSDMESQMATELEIRLSHLRSARADSALFPLLDMPTLDGQPIDETTARLGEAEYRYMIANRLRHGRRAHMLRLYQGPDVYTGRSFSSPSYGVFDNRDAAATVLNGLIESGLDASTTDVRMDLSDRRMVLKVNVPQIQVAAAEFLKGYRNPLSESHSGYAPGTEPIVESGIIVTNGETGWASLSMAPYFRIKICQNGLVITEKLAQCTYRHKGRALGVGDVPTADDTRRAFATWMGKEIRDNVAHWLTPEFMTSYIDRLTAKSGRELERPADVIGEVGKTLVWTDTEVAGIVNMFTRGGQPTSGGVLQAVTAFTQTLTSADRAWELECQAVQAMELAYAAAGRQ